MCYLSTYTLYLTIGAMNLYIKSLSLARRTRHISVCHLQNTNIMVLKLLVFYFTRRSVYAR